MRLAADHAADRERRRDRPPRPARPSASTALDADAAIDAVRLRDDTIYVVTEPAAGVITRMGGPAVACGRIATVWMCTTAAAHRAWAGDAPFD